MWTLRPPKMGHGTWDMGHGMWHWLLRQQQLLPNWLVGVSGEWGGCWGWIGCFGAALPGANNPEEPWHAPC